jgi:type VI secretion system protein ImpM
MQHEMTGLYGKLPAHGDFVRRNLPEAFVTPWDEWLQAGIIAAREELGDEFPDIWSAARPVSFHLPASACGPRPVAGVLLTSADFVGRRFPLTLAAVLPPDAAAPSREWYASLASAGSAALDNGQTADALLADVLAALPADLPAGAGGETEPEAEAGPDFGWWVADDMRWDLSGLPDPARFASLLRGTP